ncbi:MAG: HEAT repeat domain-containing protein [candidate division Zixibacteria bacterium]|nr:HEAT repeat domain-containing protein [candidate division Zixibacteria bacterium]
MNRSINLSEKSLMTDVRELSREIVHELFLICRKAGIYSSDHPMVVKGMNKPFLGMQRVFAYKKYFSIYFTGGRLYANNILITDVGASNYLKEKMHDFEIQSFLFEEHLTVEDLAAFVGRLVSRFSPGHHDSDITSFLEQRKISTILINDELAETLFDSGLRYQEGKGKSYSVRQLISDYFTGEIALAIKILTSNYENTGEQADNTGIDYHCEIVRHLLPEKFAQLPPSELKAMADHILNSHEKFDQSAINQLSQLVHSFDYHPKREVLIGLIQNELVARNIDNDAMNKSLSSPAILKMENSYDIDRIVNKFFSEESEDSLFDSFHDSFMRLVRTRQMGKASSVSETVISHLSSDNALYRQYAMILLKDITNSGISVGELNYLVVLLEQLRIMFTQGRETLEFSEIAVFILRLAIVNRRYDAVAEFLTVISSGRRFENGVTTYDSITVKRIFDDLNDRELISFLIREIYQSDTGRIKATRDILIAIQSEEVAVQLAQIVIHPNRYVRQYCLKVLSALGKPAVTIFSEILRDESNFYRPIERRELPDEQWYLVRNAIFILGNLKDSEACHALRLRLSDSDVRVRMEIVKALEKIAGENAVDLLMVLAEDPDESIREAAIITLGLFRQPGLYPFFIDLLKRQKTEILRVINAIAMTGTNEAHEYLTSLLENMSELKELTSGKASVADIKKMIISTLEKFGNEKSRQIAEDCKTNLNSNLSKTAKLLIGKFNSNS